MGICCVVREVWDIIGPERKLIRIWKGVLLKKENVQIAKEPGAPIQCWKGTTYRRWKRGIYKKEEETLIMNTIGTCKSQRGIYHQKNEGKKKVLFIKKWKGGLRQSKKDEF